MKGCWCHKFYSVSGNPSVPLSYISTVIESLSLEPSKFHDGVRCRTDRGSLLFCLLLWWCLCTPALEASWAKLLRNTMPCVMWGTVGWGLISVWSLLLNPQRSPSQCKMGGCFGVEAHIKHTVKTRAAIYGCQHFIRDNRFIYMKIFSFNLLSCIDYYAQCTEEGLRELMKSLWLESLKIAKTEFKHRSVFLPQ